jgi:hypothetical protein
MRLQSPREAAQDSKPKGGIQPERPADRMRMRAPATCDGPLPGEPERRVTAVTRKTFAAINAQLCRFIQGCVNFSNLAQS